MRLSLLPRKSEFFTLFEQHANIEIAVGLCFATRDGAKNAGTANAMRPQLGFVSAQNSESGVSRDHGRTI